MYVIKAENKAGINYRNKKIEYNKLRNKANTNQSGR